MAGSKPPTVLLRGKKVGVHMRRSEQVLVLEHVFVCPGARGVQGDKVYHECGLVELDSATLTSASSLEDLIGSFRRPRRKRGQSGKIQRVSLDVNILRMNWDPSYLHQTKAVFGVGRLGVPASTPSGRPPSRARDPLQARCQRKRPRRCI